MALITDIIDGVKRHETNSVLSRSARKYYWIKALSDWIEASSPPADGTNFVVTADGTNFVVTSDGTNFTTTNS